MITFSTDQSAERCNSCLCDLGRRHGAGAGPWSSVRAGRGEGIWWGRVGAGGRRPAGTEGSAVASESPGTTPSELRLLLLTTGRAYSTHTVHSSVRCGGRRPLRVLPQSDYCILLPSALSSSLLPFSLRDTNKLST